MPGFVAPSPSMAQFAALAAAMPVIADAVPVPESRDGAAGLEGPLVAAAGHSHPRLTSTTGRRDAADVSHTIGADGLSPAIAFTRPFASEPGIVATAILPAPADVLLPPYVAEWVMGGPGNALFTGCRIGWKKLQIDQALQKATVLSVNVVIGSSINVVQAPATGVRFNLIAVGRSDL